MTSSTYDHTVWVALAASAIGHANHFVQQFRQNKILKGLTTMNPIALIPTALTLGADAFKLVKDFTAGDKAAAIADTLDALPALAAVTGEPLADLQAIITPERLAIAWDVEQEVSHVIPLIKAALATYRAG